MNANPTPDATADAMNVLTYQHRVLYEAAGLLSEHSDCDDPAYLRKSLARSCAIVRDLATRLHAAERRQRWIPVTERTMPDEGAKVLIVTAPPTPCMTEHVTEAYWRNGRWDHDNWCTDAGASYATHWMPMPSPPLTPQTTADAPASAGNESEPRA